MADHLLKPENENIIIHEISGFMGDDLHSAFQESYAVSLGTNASQHMYSLSLNPPKGKDVSTEGFGDAINRAEKRLGLTGQPRAIVFHEKRGRDGELRRHAHCVWCRIDGEAMKAIHMPFDHLKLEDLSHELFLEHGWDVPKGFVNKAERSKLNYTHAEHQQARRCSKYADDIKRVFQDAWQQSDARDTFANALKEKGYILARGDHAAFVAVDRYGEVYSVARNLPMNTKEIRARIGEADGLPDVDQAHALAETLVPSPSHSFETAATSSRQRSAVSTKPAIPDSPNARRIKRDPEHLLSIITEREGTFTHHTVAKALSSYIDDPQTYQNAYQAILSSNHLVQLAAEGDNPKIKARYSTREMVELERRLIDNAVSMAHGARFRIPARHVEAAIHSTDKKLKHDAGVELSAEQRAAIHHVTDDKQLSCVVGVAGAGKSTILAAAREAWEANGHRVFGAALAGKAAKGLEQSSGIQSRTLASMELSWQHEANQLQRGDVLVIDEAGMIGSRQMARFITEAKDKGVKLVLVGDAEQLQPIEAGAPFRNITDEIQPATLHEVHRQKEDWQQQASKDFALGRTEEALQAYLDREHVEAAPTKNDAVQVLASDYLDNFRSSNQASQLALAHRKSDVKAINQSIRTARKAAGELEGGVTYKTEHGKREFASGDRILFTRNDYNIGVKNGMLGTVTKAENNRLTVELDDKENGQKAIKTISIKDYREFDHGYATTIHKSQGTTVDQCHVLASRTMDRHLTYVAASRHREGFKLYVDQEEFSDRFNLKRSLSRARQKQSTLDFEQRTARDIEKEAFKQMRRSQATEPQRDITLTAPKLGL